MEFLFFLPWLLGAAPTIVKALVLLTIGLIVIWHAYEEERGEVAEGLACYTEADWLILANSRRETFAYVLPPLLLSLWCLSSPIHHPETAAWWLSLGVGLWIGDAVFSHCWPLLSRGVTVAGLASAGFLFAIASGLAVWLYGEVLLDPIALVSLLFFALIWPTLRLISRL